MIETDASNSEFSRRQLRAGWAAGAVRLLCLAVALGVLPVSVWAESLSPMRDWPADGSAGWNTALPASDALSLLLWWFMLTLPGWVVWPLFSRALEPLGGAGFLLGRTLAWLLMGWVAWWLAHGVPLGNTAAWLGSAAALVCLSGIVSACRRPGWIGVFLREHWRTILCGEGLFAAALIGFTWVRMLNPDLWHPTMGGEKVMEFAFLNGILRSAELPPVDPHFAGETINYYYFGLYLVAFLAKLGRFPAEIAFTLAVPALFALSMLNAFAIALAWFRRDSRANEWRATGLALLAPMAVCVIGNPAGLPALWSDGAEALRHYDFWQASRVVDGTINEFPYWSFLFGDLHPHLISIPFFLAFLALLLTVLRAPRERLPLRPLLLSSWLMGALACLNTWDLPTAFGLLALAIFHVGRRYGLADRLGMVAACLALAWLAFLPFPLYYFAAGVSGPGFVRSPDDPLQWLPLWILPVFVLGSLLFMEVRRYPARRQVLLVAGLLALMPLLAGGLVAALCLFFLGLAVLWFERLPATNVEANFVGLLVIAGFFLLGGMQFVYLRDFLDGSDYYRMNTVFKFSIHAWVLLMLATALVLPRLLVRICSAGLYARLWLLPLAGLCLASFAFPLLGTSARVEARFQAAQGLPPTLDTLAFMEVAEFRPPGSEVAIRLREDLAALRWLERHVRGHALILESSQVDYYRHFGTRIASLTGLSGLNGLHEPEQRDSQRARRRARLHGDLWAPPDAQQACALYREQAIDIVYAGQLERIEHPGMFALLPEVVQKGCLVPMFRHESTTIYFTPAFIDYRTASGIPAEPLNVDVAEY